MKPSEMDALLLQLRLAALWHPQQLAGIEIFRAWDVRELLLADERARGYWWSSESGPADAVVAVMDEHGGQLATWLAAIGRDGFARERALLRLARDPAPDASRLIALRVDDPVEQVRGVAWRTLSERVTAEQAGVIVPVLVRLMGRCRAAKALDRYAELFHRHQRTPLWTALLDHPDRRTRRWAVTAALRDGGIDSAAAIGQLWNERDQWVADRLVDAVARHGGVEQLRQLLQSRQVRARAVAIAVLPDSELPDAAIETALLDRAATVRSAARHRALARGLAAGQLYRRVWEEHHDPRALIGAAECGEAFGLDELWAHVGDIDPRVRAVALRLMPPEQLERSQLELVFDLLDDPQPAVATAAMRLLIAQEAQWTYREAEAFWPTAKPAKRHRLWRMLSGRGGWDRVRADLLAASDQDSEVSGQGRADLRAWRESASARMWRLPSEEQLADVRSLLPTAGLDPGLREAIEFRATLR
ncbi:MAG: hypothetical protein QM804_16090 [Propionicimonas sp.]